MMPTAICPITSHPRFHMRKEPPKRQDTVIPEEPELRDLLAFWSAMKHAVSGVGSLSRARNDLTRLRYRAQRQAVRERSERELMDLPYSYTPVIPFWPFNGGAA